MKCISKTNGRDLCFGDFLLGNHVDRSIKKCELTRDGFADFVLFKTKKKKKKRVNGKQTSVLAGQ